MCHLATLSWLDDVATSDASNLSLRPRCVDTNLLHILAEGDGWQGGDDIWMTFFHCNCYGLRMTLRHISIVAKDLLNLKIGNFRIRIQIYLALI